MKIKIRDMPRGTKFWHEGIVWVLSVEVISEPRQYWFAPVATGLNGQEIAQSILAKEFPLDIEVEPVWLKPGGPQ